VSASGTTRGPDLEVRGSLGLVSLNRPERINALSLDDLRAIRRGLTEWSRDDEIGAIFLRGCGERGFCAGGDVRAIADALDETDQSYGRELFEEEYRVDYLVHRYPKPVITWGNGTVMGGGFGLYIGAGFRVVTPSSRLATPEISIGLFPDVGASFYLARLPSPLGHFLALTATPIAAGDALRLGWADVFVADEQSDDLLEQLSALELRDGMDASKRRIGALLARFGRPPSEAPLATRAARLGNVLDPASDASLHRTIAAWADDDDAWLAAASHRYRAGSPTSARVICEQLRRCGALSLADCFRLDLILAWQCLRHHDFGEGVRARLVEKRPARWHPARFEMVSDTLVAQHFEPPWAADRHPLADLESEGTLASVRDGWDDARGNGPTLPQQR